KKQIGNDCALVRRTKSRGISPKTGKFTPQNCLTGRIQYFQTRCRKAHDKQGNRIAIRLDGKEIFNSNLFDHYQKEWEIMQERDLLGRSWYDWGIPQNFKGGS
ncbi:MAG: hypothetical protein FWF59_03285, partial [Turicibacter sp.]|nr:hypothetical protein [Turicibacter sp.]